MRRTLTTLVATLLTALCVCACDEPPKAPEPSVDIDQERKELREKVEETQKKANQRIDQIAEDLPEGDAGDEDASTPADAAPADQ